MRTFLIAALLAGAATPALAARPHDDNDGPRRERSERSEAHESSPKQEHSADRPQRNVERRSESLNGAGGENHPRMDAGNMQAMERARGHDSDNTVRSSPKHEQIVETEVVEHHNVEPKMVRPPRRSSEVVSTEHSSGDTVRTWRSRERHNEDSPTSIETHNMRHAPVGGSGDLVQPKHESPRVFERAERRISRKPVFGTEPPPPRTATAIAAKPAHRWHTDWRHDRRYDWHDWRRHHHSHFHFGFYYDPFGWDYFRYGIGWRLWPSYYRNSFWLNDPWQYRLPQAYGPYRWIRYYNDALLVNIYTGEVVDVEYDVFW